MQETNTKSLKKQLAAAIAMLLVAVVALGSATYAWFVSNNTVTATTTNISAQSNSAYLVIDNAAAGETKTTSSSAATASETFDPDTKLYPAQWKNTVDTNTWQFESAYALAKDASTEKSGTRFAVGNPETAATKDYTLANTFYIGTGTYDGTFTNLTVDGMTVSTGGDKKLASALRVLVYIDENNWALVSPTKVEESCLAGTVVNSGENLGIIRTAAFGKTDGDVDVKLYVFYDGADTEVKTTQLTELQQEVGATVSFSATPKEFK